ncbi:SSI family serine proteinase inhibitor [Nonomuraea gerenzanensis]|uniref:Protease inhibitor, SSI family (Subtilisin inhibitor) n=1 Tax=Nonomuraea gerenzanensis TaxID=93944 RepID=A0A1M4EKC1_9ACTN|nr:SSI family serine proteinase inhibitor [Nonomuraea gerenzanensis]UBU10811.1 subtilase-type protease inhibitor [Nonomuraea gerenzanensis]SBO99244.1 Protease inhibitor, SSI family (subtilisin inhibitor) [Nonomuraea gerenzanensis]
MSLVLTAARRLAVLGLCAAAALAGPFTTLPANAAAGADLYITVTPRDGGAYSMHLTCDPDGGFHPFPRAACGALHEVDGYLARLDVDPGPCPLIWDPVEVEATGHWYGRPNSYYEEFPNRCVLERRLGPVAG